MKFDKNLNQIFVDKKENIIFCDQSCEYLSVAEQNQYNNKIDHLCKINADRHERLIHDGHQPELVSGKNCYKNKMKNYLHEKPKYKSDQEKILQALQAQLIELHKNGGHEKNIRIKCACCEKSFYISVLFRCYHCGLWFCASCSKPHFGDKPSYIYDLPDESESDKGSEI